MQRHGLSKRQPLEAFLLILQPLNPFYCPFLHDLGVFGAGRIDKGLGQSTRSLILGILMSYASQYWLQSTAKKELL